MTVLTLPAAPGFADARWALRARTQTFTSPLSGARQTLELAGARWVLEARLPSMNDAESRAWQTVIARLRGAAGRFYAGPPGYRRRGAGGGAPVVDGAGQSGASLSIRGLPGGQIGVLRQGDYLSVPAGVGLQLHMAVADVDADAGERATIVIEPPLRSGPVDGAPVDVDTPRCVMALEGDEQAFAATPGPAEGGLPQPLWRAPAIKAVETWL